MIRTTRRALVGGAAAFGIAGAVKAPAVIARQNAPVEIAFYHIWGTPPGGEAAATKHPADLVVDAFNAQSTTVKVTAQTPGNYYETLQKAQADMAAGNDPALVMTPWSNINYADEGLAIVPIEEVAGDQFDTLFANFNADVLDLVKVDDRTLGVPYAFSCPVLYYNADVLGTAGVDPAAMFGTWEGFATEAPKVQTALGGNPVIAFGGNKDWPAQSIIQGNGGRVVDDSGAFVVDSAESTAAMQAIADLDAAGLYDRSAPAEMRPSFVGGSTAVFVSSIASLGGLAGEVQFELGTMPFPTFGTTPRLANSGGSFIGVYARETEQQQAALEFLTYALGEEGYTIWMQTGYLNITTFDIPRLPLQEAAYLQLDEGLTSETRWPGSRAAEAQAAWGTYVDRIWANDIAVAEGLAMAVEEVEAIVG